MEQSEQRGEGEEGRDARARCGEHGEESEGALSIEHPLTPAPGEPGVGAGAGRGGLRPGGDESPAEPEKCLDLVDLPPLVGTP